MLAITPNRTDITPFLPPLSASEVFRRKQRRSARCAAEYDIGTTDMFFHQPVVFSVFVAHDAEIDLVVWFSEMFPFGGGVDVGHELAGAGEVPVYDVHVVDLWAAEKQGETDVPEGLGAGAEDSDGVDAAAAVEDYGCGEGGAKGSELCGGEEAVGFARCGEEGEGADGIGGLGACHRIICAGGRCQREIGHLRCWCCWLSRRSWDACSAGRACCRGRGGGRVDRCHTPIMLLWLGDGG